MLQRLRPSEKSATVTIEDALAAEAQADPGAFAAIYNRQFAGIYGYCYRERGSTERAEDAAQQIFEQALTSLPRYREAGKFRSWLYAVDAETGTERWQAPGAGTITTPAVMDGVVYTSGEGGRLFALDAATGSASCRPSRHSRQYTRSATGPGHRPGPVACTRGGRPCGGYSFPRR